MSLPLSEHLPLIASAPDGIQKLRGLILELAVRGKLLPQDPNEEPTGELLKRITQERFRQEADGACKKSKPMSPVGVAEQPFSIPTSWKWVRVGLLGDTQTGTTPSKSQTHFFGTDYPFIKPGDISAVNIDYENEGLSAEGVKASGRLAPPRSILMVCIGTIGKCGVIDRTCSFNQQINSVSPLADTSPFAFLVLRSPYFQAEAWERSSSTTIAILNKGNWETIPVPLPPIAEQHRIVAKVDELMALCDRLESEQNDSTAAHGQLIETLLGTLTQSTDAADFEANWKRIAEHFDTLFTTEASIDALQKSILQLAVMGRLLPIDSIDEQRNWKDGVFSDFFSLEYGDNLPAPKRSGTGEYSVFGSNGVVGTHNECRVTSPCIVVGRKGSAGALNCCRELGCWVTDVAYYCVPPESVDLDFAFALFQTLGLDTLGKGIKPGLSRSEAYLIPVAIPEITEQRLIVAKVNELIAVCDQLKASIKAATAAQSTLSSALIQQTLEAA